MTIYRGKDSKPPRGRYERYLKDGVSTTDDLEAAKAAREAPDGINNTERRGNVDWANMPESQKNALNDWVASRQSGRTSDQAAGDAMWSMDRTAGIPQPPPPDDAQQIDGAEELPPDQVPNYKQGPTFDDTKPPITMNRVVKEPPASYAQPGKYKVGTPQLRQRPGENGGLPLPPRREQASYQSKPLETPAAKTVPTDGSDLQSHEPNASFQPPEPNASFDDGVSQAQKIGGASDPGMEAENASNEPSSDAPDNPPPNVQAAGQQPQRDSTLKDLVAQWISAKKPKDNNGFLAAMSQLEQAGEGLAGIKHGKSYIDNKMEQNNQEGKDWESEQAKRQAMVQEYAKQKWQTDENALNRTSEGERHKAEDKARIDAAALAETNRQKRFEVGQTNAQTRVETLMGGRKGLAAETAADKGLKDMTPQNTVQAANDVQEMLNNAAPGQLKGFDSMANTAEGMPGFLGQAGGSVVRALEGPEAQKNAAIVDRFMNQQIKDQAGANVTGNELYRQYMAGGRGKFQGEQLTRWALQQTINAFKAADERRLKSMRPEAQKLVQEQRPGAIPQYINSGQQNIDDHFEE